MVSNTTWYRAVVATTLSVFLILLLQYYSDIAREEVIVGSVYSATAPDTDLVIVDGIKKEKQQTLQTGTRAVILPHHLVASQAITKGVRAVSATKPPIIFVLSPDHFNRCPKNFCTSYGSYETFFGDVFIDKNSVADLLLDSKQFGTSTLFQNEHGITAIVPFIKYYLPNTLVVPIVVSVRKKMSERVLDEVSEKINALLKKTEGVLLVSSDFSHYLPLQESNEYDKESEQAICSGVVDKLLTLNNPKHSDCPVCLALIQKIAEKNNLKPQAVWHSNSATLLKDDSVKETTSHFTFLYKEGTNHKCTTLE